MSCHFPITAYRGRKESANGKIPMVFKPEHAADPYNPIPLPCGKCTGCQQKVATDWKIRIIHESQLHQDNSVVTLTYSNDYLPPHRILVKHHLSRFLKRTRKISGNGIRFFGVGAYGGQFGRPHYHVVLFGKSWGHLELWKANVQDPSKNLYITPEISEPRPGHTEEPLWKYGYHTVGILQPASAGYIANYLIDQENTHQEDYCDNALCIYRRAECPKPRQFRLMSRGGRTGHGIAYDWITKHHSDVYPKDGVHVGNRLEKPPRYYDNFYAEHREDTMKEVKRQRQHYAQQHPRDARELVLLDEYHREQRKQINREKKRKGRQKMELELFSVLDRKAMLFDRPFPSINAATATRAISMELKRNDNAWRQYPDDYALCRLATWDEKTGTITQTEARFTIIAELRALLPQEV